MNETATEKHLYDIPQQNLRRLRAESFGAAIIQEIEPFLTSDCERRDIYDALLKVLYENGVSWTTEDERRALGFEPRDDQGWTPSEKVKAEQMKREALAAFMQPVVLETKP